MKICFYLDPSHLRFWQTQLADRLATEFKAEISCALSHPNPHPHHIEKLLAFEKKHFHSEDTISSDPITLDYLHDKIPLKERNVSPDLLIDFVGDDKEPKAEKALRVLFNGHVGELSLITSIMDIGLPQVAFRNQCGQIVATAQPSSELAIGTIGSMDQVYARLATLLCAWLKNPDRWVQPLNLRKSRILSTNTVISRTIATTLKVMLKRTYYSLFRPSHWRIGWRWVEEEDVWSRESLSGEPWHVLADEESHFYADPFPWLHDGRYFLFFEDLDHRIGKGVISVLSFDEQGKPDVISPCLEEDYHLSYPYLFEDDGEIYMIPETSENRDVALYKTNNFPFGWKRHKTLLTDIEASDVSIFQQNGKWWIFCATRDGAGGYSDCLSIFHADKLEGPWHPHAQNPVMIDAAVTRPAGNFVQRDGRLLRPAQDCTEYYGASLNLIEVTKLTPTHYEQKTLTGLVPDVHWPGRKLHTLSRFGALEAIDGVILRPRMSVLRWLAEWIFRPLSDKGAKGDRVYMPMRANHAVSRQSFQSGKAHSNPGYS